jgi:hypothetical protein
MEFSENQPLLIDSMIEQDSESIRDFYGDGPGYDIFLRNSRITPEKELEINQILNFANNMDFSNHQLQLIYAMIQEHFLSIRDYCDINSLDYNVFLENHNITPIKKIVINSILTQANNMEFSNEQQELIYTMIQLNSLSVRNYCNENSFEHDFFLQNYQITPSKEIVINYILKNARDLNPDTNEGFNKPELQKIKKRFDINKIKLPKISQKNKRDFLTYKRKLSYMKPRPSSHTMTTRNITKKTRGRGKTKKKKKKNKKKKRKSYKK